MFQQGLEEYNLTNWIANTDFKGVSNVEENCA